MQSYLLGDFWYAEFRPVQPRPMPRSPHHIVSYRRSILWSILRDESGLNSLVMECASWHNAGWKSRDLAALKDRKDHLPTCCTRRG